MLIDQKTTVLDELRHKVRRMERGDVPKANAVLPFCIPAIDNHLPQHGLMLGALHEVRAETGIAHEAASTLFVAGILARLEGHVLWCFSKRDLFAPSLANVGLGFDRVIYAEAGDEKNILLIMEEGLRYGSLAGVVGEVSRLSTVASRRLHLAARESGVTAFALHRPKKFQKDKTQEPSAAISRWRIGSIASTALPVNGIGPAQWSIQLDYCRDAEPAVWQMGASDATGYLGFPSNLADRSFAEGSAPGFTARIAVGYGFEGRQ